MVRLSREQIKARQDWAQVQSLEATGRRGRRTAGAK